MPRIIVVGAGVIGAACALRLRECGAEVVVVDRAGVAAETSSRCEGNILVSDKSPGPEAELAMLSARAWRELAARLDDDRAPGQPSTEYQAKGGVVVALEDSVDPLRAFADRQRGIGIRAHECDPAQVHALEPHLTPDAAFGVHYPDDAQVQPSLATQAMLARAIRLGATLRIATVVAALRAGTRIVGVRTSTGDLHGDAVVNCAGPWAGELAAVLGAHLAVRPRRGTILVTAPMPQRVFHKVYDADYVDAVASSEADLQTSAVVESTPAGTVLIGSSRERVGFSDRDTLPALVEVAAKAVRLFPFLADTTLLRTYHGFRPSTPDRLPAIGADGELAGLFHAAGHEGAGIGLAPTTAELVAHAVLGTPAPIDPAPFLPTRGRVDESAA
ncbi:NAD(P)/FAD-dependent oxidoreductase [Microbacterium sp.]|uniref:NAD(P)/FAD-dependent oxidoreductase n=1 Tax=Microbacterium sp. TaxID=51671 RepID=UPI0039E4241D